MTSAMRYRVRRPQVINQTIDGEVVIINFATGHYYSLMGTGAEIWHSIERTVSVHRIVAALAHHFKAPRETLESAVVRFLDELQREGLIEARGEGAGEDAVALASPADADPLPQRAAFESPVLEKYEDMRDLILLDPVHAIDEAEDRPEDRPSAGR